jgi:hypothetical protein
MEIGGVQKSEGISLQSPRKRLLQRFFLCLMYGVTLGIILIIANIFYQGFSVERVIGYLMVGNGVTFFGWCAEQLWLSTISKMFKNPFSWFAYLTRVPFWYFSGGIGYTLGILLSKKFGMINESDIPIKPIFYTGGKIGIAIQVLVQIVTYRSSVKMRNRESVHEHSR